MDKAIEKVNELIAIDMGSLVEDKKDARRERVRHYYSMQVCPPNITE